MSSLTRRTLQIITDIYLFALAVQNEGKLVTSDTGIPLAAVRKATTQKLLIL
jgi:hypothetical protein